MLKNVAIPLLLAASEAGAQKDRIAEAMEADEDVKVPRLVADAAACTAATDTGNDSIESAANAESAAQQAWEGAKQKVAELIDAAGAWGKADAARKEAVEAAAAQEVAENIAGLIDAMDDAAGDERAKAKLWLEAEAARRAGAVELQTLTDRLQEATDLKGTLEQAKDKAAEAVQAVKDQKASELLAREFLYCELGAKTGSDVGLTNWYDVLTLTGSGGTVAATGSAPKTCTVPAVKDAAGNVVRPAVVYFINKANPDNAAQPANVDGTDFLSAESDTDSYKRWTAARRLAEAEAAETAETYQAVPNSNADLRTAAGVVNYRTGVKLKADWHLERMSAELAFYTFVKNQGSAAQLEANAQASDANAVGGANSVIGLTENADGASKALARALAVRDSNGDGSVTDNAAQNPVSIFGSAWQLPSTRAQNNSDTWDTDWTAPVFGDLNTWKTGTGWAANNKQYAWWQLTADFNTEVAAWHAGWAAKGGATKMAHGTFDTLPDGGGDKVCKTDTGGAGGNGTWVTSGVDHTVHSANEAGCRTVCETVSRAGVLVDPDTKDAQGNVTVNKGGQTMAKYATAPEYCGAYSWNDAGGANACGYMTGADDAQEDTGGSTAGKCVNMKSNGGSTGTKDFYDLAKAVYDKYVLLDASSGAALTAVQGQMDAQAAYEQAWLEAWYLKQYWTALNSELDNTKSGSTAKTYKDLFDKRSGDVNQVDESEAEATSAASTAKTNLESAEATLAALVSTTSAATAVTVDLGKRIARIDAELAELKTLVTDNADGTGTLEKAAKKRLDDYDTFTSATQGSEGEFTLATAAKDAAQKLLVQQVLLGDGVTVDPKTTEGSLAATLRLAAAAWKKAQEDATAAEEAVTAALGDATLAGLRAEVTSKSGDWGTQNLELVKLEGEVTQAWVDYQAAQKLTAERIEACQLAKYDAYRKELKKQMDAREKALGEIKALIEAEKAPALGTAGARCEKALSNGTYRPRMAQGRETVCDEGLCCGAARVWMPVGAGEADAAWKTVETCQPETAENYDYQPPRPPMATTMPATVSVPFACIEGAQKLAAAASALAAAVYMLA